MRKSLRQSREYVNKARLRGRGAGHRYTGRAGGYYAEELRELVAHFERRGGERRVGLKGVCKVEC